MHLARDTHWSPTALILALLVRPLPNRARRGRPTRRRRRGSRRATHAGRRAGRMYSRARHQSLRAWPGGHEPAGHRAEPRRQARLRGLLRQQRDRRLRARPPNRRARAALGTARLRAARGRRLVLGRTGDRTPELDRSQPRRGKRLRHVCRQRRAGRVRSRPANRGPSPARGRGRLSQPAPGRRLRRRPRAQRAHQRRREPRRRPRVRGGAALPERRGRARGEPPTGA